MTATITPPFKILLVMYLIGSMIATFFIGVVLMNGIPIVAAMTNELSSFIIRIIEVFT